MKGLKSAGTFLEIQPYIYLSFLRVRTLDIYIDYIHNYTTVQVILAFSLVLAYDLLQDRRTLDVIITKFFPLFKIV